jgi:hypothetical protein
MSNKKVQPNEPVEVETPELELGEEELDGDVLIEAGGLTGVALFDVLEEDELNDLVDSAARLCRRFYGALIKTTSEDGLSAKIGDEMAYNFTYDFHRRLWGVREESGS